MTKHATYVRGLLPSAIRESVFTCFCVSFAAALSILPAAPPAYAQESKPVPAWQSILALQLSSTQRCDLDKVLFFHEVPVGDSVSTEGRARCLDGREYDFSRDRSHEKFTLRLCQPTVC